MKERLEFKLKNSPLSEILSITFMDTNIGQVFYLEPELQDEPDVKINNSDYSYRTIKIVTKNSFIELKKNKVNLKISNENAQDLQTLLNIDIKEQLKEVFLNEIIQNITKKTIEQINLLAHKIYYENFKWYHKFLRFFNKKYVIKNKTKDLFNLINKESGKIAKESRLGPADIIITNNRLGAIISDLNFFQPNPSEEQSNYFGNLIKTGIINKFKVFIDINQKENYVLICKENNNLQRGVRLFINSNVNILESDIMEIGNLSPDKNISVEYYSKSCPAGKCERNYRKIYFKL